MSWLYDVVIAVLAIVVTGDGWHMRHQARLIASLRAELGERRRENGELKMAARGDRG